MHLSKDGSIRKILVETSPAPGVNPHCISFYNRSSGRSRLRWNGQASRSDTMDTEKWSFSEDGKSYEFLRDSAPLKRIAQGTVRDYFRIPLVCPAGRVPDGRERLLLFFNRALLPTDHPLEGMRNWTLWRQTSFDGGRTIAADEPVVQDGADYGPMHCFEGVRTGKNAIMLGDHTQQALLTARQPDPGENDKILLGVQISNTDEAGNYFNPGSGLTYTYCAVLHGKWTAEGALRWTISDRVKLSPERSRRGLIEPTLAEMDDGRLLMILRGSNQGRNDKDPERLIPGYRWRSVSEDGGKSWSEPEPWGYETGEAFYSPSSCSQLLHHSNGAVYWIGNVCDRNPVGNSPRYPLVIGEVDPPSLLLKKASLRVIATREAEQSENVTYSNFFAQENRDTRDIEVHLTPFRRREDAPYQNNAYRYEIPVEARGA